MWNYVMAGAIICQQCGKKKRKKITWSCQFVLRIFKAIYEMYEEWFGIQALYVSNFYVRHPTNTWDVFDFDILKKSA